MVSCYRFVCPRGDECPCKKDAANIERFKDLLRQIGYPRRGTEEENMDIYAAAKLIQADFSSEELEILSREQEKP